MAKSGDQHSRLPADIDELNAVCSVLEEHSREYSIPAMDVGQEAGLAVPMYWSSINSSQLIGAMTRFRMGIHGLRTDTGRHGPVRLNRNDKICHLCERGEREDEAHQVFECLAFDEARKQA